MNIPLISQQIKIPSIGLTDFNPSFNNNIDKPIKGFSTPIDLNTKPPTGFLATPLDTNIVTQGRSGILPSIPLQNPYTTIDQAVLSNLNIGLMNGNNLLISPNVGSNDIKITQPVFLSKDELSKISFDKILDQPLSLNSLFSEEMRDLVKNLVEIQKSKAQALQHTYTDQASEIGSIKNILEGSHPTVNMQLENSSPLVPALNHLLSSNQLDGINKENSSERKSTNRQKPTWDEQPDVPYSDKSKKEPASLLKLALSKMGHGLEKLSTLLQELANR